MYTCMSVYVYVVRTLYVYMYECLCVHTITTLYLLRSGSLMTSLKSKPSVQYLMRVLALYFSSNRTAYPTCTRVTLMRVHNCVAGVPPRQQTCPFHQPPDRRQSLPPYDEVECIQQLHTQTKRAYTNADKPDKHTMVELHTSASLCPSVFM
jgi:hypothetical protein